MNRSIIAITTMLGLGMGLSSATTISILVSVPNGSAVGGTGSGQGALTTTEGSITLLPGGPSIPTSTYTISGIDLTSEGGSADETIVFEITYTSNIFTPNFNAFGNVAVGGNTFIDAPFNETLTTSVAMVSSTFGGTSLDGFDRMRLGAFGNTETADIIHGGGTIKALGNDVPTPAGAPNDTYAISGTSFTVQPTNFHSVNLQGFGLTFTAVPEPSAAVLSALGALSLLRRKRQ